MRDGNTDGFSFAQKLKPIEPKAKPSCKVKSFLRPAARYENSKLRVQSQIHTHWSFMRGQYLSNTKY